MKKVLVIGREVSDFLCPLFRTVGELYPLEIHLLETRKVSPKEDEIESSFAARHYINTDLKGLSKMELAKIILPAAARFFTGGKNFKECLRYELVKKECKKIFDQFDVFNIQFLTQEAVYIAGFIPNTKKVILSFWGSDLFHCNENFEYRAQKEIIERSSSVIVHSPEMKNIFLSKFGRHLKNKVHDFLIVNRPVSLNVITDQIAQKAQITKRFRQLHEIPEESTIIAIGHSAHELDCHIQTINALSQLPRQVKQSVFLVLPMTYGNVGTYTNEVEHYCKNSGFAYKIFKDFMNFDDMIALRMSSEIVLRLSEFDAFSLALCESLCAGNIVIAGCWLPYSKLRTEGVYYLEAQNFQHMLAVLQQVIQLKGVFEKNCMDNTQKTQNIFANQNAPELLGQLFLN